MSKPAVYYWAPVSPTGIVGDNNQIAQNQSVAAGDNLILVSNTPAQPGAFSYVNTINPNTSTSGISANVIRSINITSVVGVGGTTFTITGLGCDQIDANGNPLTIVHPITEEINVAASGINTSDYLYTEIYSINSSNDVASVYVGYGPEGITAFYDIDNNRNIASVYGVSYSYQMIANAGLTAATYGSLNKPSAPNTIGGILPFGIINGTQIGFMLAFPIDGGGITADTINAPPFGTATIWANISNCTTDSVLFTVLQDGI